MQPEAINDARTAPAPAALDNNKTASPGRTLLLSALLGFAVLLVFWPVRSFDFLNYDDPDYVTDNPVVQQGLTAQGLGWAFQTGHASNWHPLTWMSHMLDCQLFQLNPAGHHTTSLLFHLFNTMLLFGLLKQMTGATWRSFFVAAVFGLHPMRAESVAWVAERKDVLSSFFGLLAIWAYTCYVKKSEVRRQESEGRQPLESRRHASRFYFLTSNFYLLSLLLFSCSLMSKPMWVTLPFVLLLLDYWPLRQFSSPALPVRYLAEKVPFVALSVASCVMTFIAQKKGGAIASLGSLPLMDRVANAFVSYLAYILKTLWPAQLSPLYPRAAWPAWMVAVSGAALLAITIVVFRSAKRQPYLAVGWLWFLGALVPVIGLVQVGIQSMADRYSYIPTVGILVMITWGVCEWLGTKPVGEKLLPIAGCLAVGGCVMVTHGQLGCWQDSIALYRRVLNVADSNPLYRAAIETFQPYADIRNNFGHALADAGKFDEAFAQFEAGLRLNPKHVEIHDNYGNALGQARRPDLALTHFTVALQENPNDAAVHTDFAIALAMMGKVDQAVDHLREAIRLDPNMAGAHANLANAFAVQQKFDLAIPEFQTALRLKPYQAHVHVNLATALRELGRLDEAIEHYSFALTLRPDNPATHFQLGLTLAAKGRREEAVAHYRQALRLDPNFAPAQQQLNSMQR